MESGSSLIWVWMSVKLFISWQLGGGWGARNSSELLNLVKLQSLDLENDYC